MRKRSILCAAPGLLLFIKMGCALAQPLDAEIRWTQFGVPHVKANDFESLGYGYGYAVAADRLCLLADRVVTLRGERSRWFGAEGAATVGFVATSNLDADLFHRVQLSEESVAAAARSLTKDTRALARGYAAGFNRYVNELPAPARAAACHGAPLPAMEEADVVRSMMSIGILWKSFQLAPFAGASAWGSAPAPSAPASVPPRSPSGIGSNAWAYGADVTRTGSAIVIANPHSFWQHSWLSMHQLHLTVPGKIDVAGADFAGLPLPVAGFNADLAWSIEAPETVTYFVMLKMQIETGRHPAYVVDGKRRALRISPLAIDVKQSDGSLARRTFPIARSELGALYRLPSMPDRPEGWYAITDAGEGNALGLDQMLAIARSRTVGEFRDATARYRGLGSHLVAGDRHGDALYIEAGPLLAIDDASLDRCHIKDAAFNILDGSRAACFARAADGRPKLAPPAQLPALRTRGIVQNTNNSYHLSIHGERAGGYSMLLGAAAQHDLRIQMSERRMQEITADGRVSPEETLAVVYDNRNYAAETWLDSILAACETPDIGERRTRACAILSRWDRTNNAASRGALLFQLLWPRLASMPGLLPPFDPEHPFAERPMARAPAALAAIATALQETVLELESLKLTGDEPWGSILASQSPRGKIPLHGGSAEAGVLNVLEGAALGQHGYAAIVVGTAYLQRVRWEGNRVVADVVLAHGQSIDPASRHHADQLRIFAEQRLVRMPFFDAEIAADVAFKTVRLRADR